MQGGGRGLCSSRLGLVKGNFNGFILGAFIVPYHLYLIRMIGSLANDEFERVWKQGVMT